MVPLTKYLQYLKFDNVISLAKTIQRKKKNSNKNYMQFAPLATNFCLAIYVSLCRCVVIVVVKLHVVCSFTSSIWIGCSNTSSCIPFFFILRSLKFSCGDKYLKLEWTGSMRLIIFNYPFLCTYLKCIYLRWFPSLFWLER